MKTNNEIWNNRRMWIAPNNENKEFFDSCKSDVVYWNKVGKGPIKDIHAAIEKQKTLVEEEMTETELALDKRDVVNFLDGLCDVFVVQSQLEHLLKTEGNCDLVRSYYDSIEDCFEWQDNIRGLLSSFYGNWKCALREVLASNWTKFDYYEADSEDQYDKHAKKLQTQQDYGEEVIWTKRDDYVVYQNKDTLKILKGREYRKPSLEQFI